MSGFLAATNTLGATIFQLSMELSPIMFVNGIANQFEGGMVPIISYTEADHFVLTALTGNNPFQLSDFFAHFQPLPGSTLLDLQIGTYPFANQSVAANATISQPLTLSYLMRCPARGFAGFLGKLDTMINLQQVVNTHASLGGTYTCLTPAGYFPNGICTAIRDVSNTEDKQVQNAYQWDFVFPLLTLNQAQTAQNSLMQKITGQTQISGAPSWSGPAATVGAPQSLVTSTVIPEASSLPPVATFQ